MSEAVEEKPAEVERKLETLNYRAEFNKSLAKFRQQVKAPSKNGHVSYKSTHYDYVLLDDLIKSIDEGAKDTGLSWRQEAETVKGGVKVRTIISHESGYDYTSPWITLGSGTAPQDVGSAITYAKRYSLGTTFGVSSESDDDGEAAQESSRQQPQQNQQQQRSQSNYNNQNRSKKQSKQSRQQPMVTSEQVQTLESLFKAIGKVANMGEKAIAGSYLAKVRVNGKEVTNVRQLTKAMADDLISRANQKLKSMGQEQQAEQNGANSEQSGANQEQNRANGEQKEALGAR